MNCISLFSGIGGLDLAAESCGFQVKVMVEIDEFCRSVLNKHFRGVDIHRDIYNFNAENYTNIDIVFGGFPCQPFSVAGNRKGEKDERYLWNEMLRVIKESKPRWVVGENVKGLLTSGIERIVSDLKLEGYTVWTQVFSASSTGALHQRERLFIVGFNAERPISDTTSNGRNGCKGIAGDSQINAGATQRKDKTECSEGRCGIRSVLPFGDYQKQWRTLPSILRVSDGVSRKLDKRRIKSLGNAVVPQQALVIFNAIKNFENELKGN